MKAEIPQAESPARSGIRGMVVRGIKSNHSSAVHSLAALTAAQRIVLRCIAQGKMTKEIAAALGVSESGVNYHKARIYKLLQVNSNVAAARVYLRWRESYLRWRKSL